MRRISAILLLMMFFGVSCKDKSAPKEAEATQETEVVKEVVETPKTYAEISIAEGGEWIDGPRDHKEYSGGTSFKNVTSLKVPEQHTDHSWYIRYEGPGWESSKVGYRLYLDWRNAIDIFGKVTDEMVLSQVGQDGFDSYHELQSWGMDILKAGKSMGIGSLGRYDGTEVLHFNEVDSTFANVENMANMSVVNVDYFGWKTMDDKIDLKSQLSIQPDSRMTKHTMTPSKAISGICTGIVKFDGIDLIQKESDTSDWAYIATYGEQSLVPDNLGMAVFYKKSTVEQVVEGPHDHIVVFKPTTEAVSFYFLGAWEKEKDGITTKEGFLTYLDGLLLELNNNTL